MTIKKTEDRITKIYNYKYENIITKEMLEKDMYELKLSQRAIADKYKIGKGTVQNLQYKNKLEISNMFERRVPRSLTEIQKQLVFGTSIADGHLFRKNERCHGALKICHSVKQEEYVNYKFDILKDFIRTSPTIQISTLNGKTHKCKSFRTLTHDFFTFVHDKLYEKNNERYIKKLNIDILNKIEPLGLAIMYMDDGTAHHKSRDFCFESFTQEDQQMFCDWLKDKFNLEARVIKYCSGTGFRTRIISRSVNDFINVIEPHILKDFSYKM